MSLDGNVFPAVLTMLRGLKDASGNVLIRGVSEGMTMSIPESPWCWVEFASFEAPENSGVALEDTDWAMTATLFWESSNDRGNAETSITALLEPIRAAVRAHVKLGDQNIARAWVQRGQGGFMLVNGIWYRTITVNISIREKISVTRSA